jgi:hypothetical protein
MVGRRASFRARYSSASAAAIAPAWFLWSIDAAAFDAAQEHPLRWRGTSRAVEDVDVAIDALVEHGARHGRDAQRTEARRVAQRTRSQRSPAHAATYSAGSPATSPRASARSTPRA